MAEDNKKGYKYCSALGCLKNTKRRRMFRLPTDFERRKQWLVSLRREDLINSPAKSARVCALHFSENDIVRGNNRTRLRHKHAIPALKPNRIETPNVDDKFTQTVLPRDTQDSAVNTRKHELKINATSAMKQKTDNANQLIESSNSSSTELAKIVKPSVLATSDSLEFKAFCLNLYYTSPQAYNLLKKSMNLPTEISLTRMLLPKGTPVERHFIDVLKIKAEQMTDAERNCSLVVSSIDLKAKFYYNVTEDKVHGFHEINGLPYPEPATFALVAMVRGIFNDYSYPVGVAILAHRNHNVSMWLDDLITSLYKIGIKVRVLVGASSPTSTKNPYYQVLEIDKKIYYLVDPKKIMKMIRDYLMDYDFYFGSYVAKWDHIVKFYEKDKIRQMPIAPKLTDKHINLNDADKLNIKYALEVLSGTVAKGLAMYAEFGAIEPSAEGTAIFIRMVNDLFDLLNSSERDGPTTKFQKAFNGDIHQVFFLKQMLKTFDSLKLIDPKTGENVTSALKLIEDLQLSIRVLLELQTDLKNEGHSSILTKRLNKDCIDDYFKRISKLNKNKSTLTVWQFISAIRKMFILDLFKPTKEKHRSHIISRMLKLSSDKFNRISNNLDTGALPAISTKDYANLNFKGKNTLVYVVGFLLYKCVKIHKDCEKFENYITSPHPGSVMITYSYRTETDMVEEMYLIPNDFIQFVASLEKSFNTYWDTKFTSIDLMNHLLELVQGLTFKLPCECFPLLYCKKLFMRMKLFHTLKYNNTTFKQKHDCVVFIPVTLIDLK